MVKLSEVAGFCEDGNESTNFALRVGKILTNFVTSIHTALEKCNYSAVHSIFSVLETCHASYSMPVDVEGIPEFLLRP